MTDVEIKKETKYEVNTKGEAIRIQKDTGDKIKAGAKAVGNKIKDPDRDLESEYEKEKLWEK